MDEDAYLMLSGLQHFVYCPRQWALIHIEQCWEDNYFTIDGTLMHEKAHDTTFTESRGDTLITHGMAIHSHSLMVSGACDVVEFHRCSKGISLAGRQGLWQPYPIEYKHGAVTKSQEADALQLCAQAICLEEMLCCTIEEGAVFYGQSKRRLPVTFSEELRGQVRSSLAQMQEYHRRGYTPKGKPGKQCTGCSLKEQCLPKLAKKKDMQSYLQWAMEDTV